MADKVAEELSSLRRNFWLIGTALILIIVLYMIRPIFLVFTLLFAGILLAILLDTLANILEQKIHLSRRLAITIILILVILFSSLGIWITGKKIATESTQLAKRIPKAINIIREYLDKQEWGNSLLAFIPKADRLWSIGQGMIGELTGFFSGAVGFLSYLGFIAFTGIFLSINPGLYKKGILKLLPKENRKRGREIIAAIVRALRWWLIGRFISMVVIGLLTAAGLIIIGFPGVLILSTVAGILSFIPIIGPIGAFIPAAMVSLAGDPSQIINVGLVYLAVQIAESNLITPIVQQKTISLPPVIMLTVQVLMGLLLGLTGIAVATPLILTIIIMVQKIYIQDILGDSVKVLGQHLN